MNTKRIEGRGQYRTPRHDVRRAAAVEHDQDDEQEKMPASPRRRCHPRDQDRNRRPPTGRGDVAGTAVGTRCPLRRTVAQSNPGRRSAGGQASLTTAGAVVLDHRGGRVEPRGLYA